MLPSSHNSYEKIENFVLSIRKYNNKSSYLDLKTATDEKIKEYKNKVLDNL